MGRLQVFGAVMKVFVSNLKNIPKGSSPSWSVRLLQIWSIVPQAPKMIKILKYGATINLLNLMVNLVKGSISEFVIIVQAYGTFLIAAYRISFRLYDIYKMNSGQL